MPDKILKKQTTIKTLVSISGIGVHTGLKVNLTLKPALPDTGIIFKRMDLKNSPEVKADIKYAIKPYNCTILIKKDVKIMTCEHFLAALFGMGIDNVIVEIDNIEVPALDGSSLEFVKLLKKAGKIFQNKRKKEFKIEKNLIVSNRILPNNDKYILVLPSDKLKITYFLSHPHPKIGEQSITLDINKQNFIKKISIARTFSTYSEALLLRSSGMAKGGSLKNAVLITKKGYSSPLRHPQEFTLHKILDIIGDLSLLSPLISCHIIGIKSGHSENHLLVKELSKYIKSL